MTSYDERVTGKLNVTVAGLQEDSDVFEFGGSEGLYQVQFFN